MPTAIKKPTLPEWADPAQASVLDPLHIQLARRAAGALGLDDPSAGAMEMVAPLISIFKNKAARQVGNKVFDRMADKFPKEFKDAFTQFAERYPRVAAHMRPQLIGKDTYIDGYPEIAAIDPPPTQYFSRTAKGPMRMLVTPEGVRGTEQVGPGFARRTVAHEGTHAAQFLGNKDLPSLNDAVTRLVGYVDNPIEVAARLAEKRGTLAWPSRMQGSGYNVTRALEQLAKARMAENVTPQQKKAMKRLQLLLQDRANAPLKGARQR